jgi:Tfp pilus assembly protein PilF
VLRNLGVTLFQLGRWEAAIPVLVHATNIDPSLAEAWTCLGLAHEAQRTWKPAAEALERALALTPQQVPLWLTLAQVYLRLGDVNSAASG